MKILDERHFKNYVCTTDERQEVSGKALASLAAGGCDTNTLILHATCTKFELNKGRELRASNRGEAPAIYLAQPEGLGPHCRTRTEGQRPGSLQRFTNGQAVGPSHSVGTKYRALQVGRGKRMDLRPAFKSHVDAICRSITNGQTLNTNSNAIAIAELNGKALAVGFPSVGSFAATNRQLAPCGSQIPRFCLAFLVLLLSLSTSSAAAHNQQQNQLEVKTDRSEIQIADPFSLEIKLLARKGTQASFPSLPSTIGPFEVLDSADRFDMPVIDDPDKRTWTRTLTLETIETGKLKIPGFEVSLTDLENRMQVIRSNPIAVEVASVVEDDADLSQFQDLADLHDVQPSSSSPYRWAWWVTGVAAIALAGGGLFLLATRKPRAVSPSAWALKELDEIPQQDVAQLERTLRIFIASRFEFPAESCSSEQTITTLEEKNVDQAYLLSLREIFERSERTKFGGVCLAESESQRLFASGRKLIQQLDQYTEAN